MRLPNQSASVLRVVSTTPIATIDYLNSVFPQQRTSQSRLRSVVVQDEGAKCSNCICTEGKCECAACDFTFS